MCSRCQEALPLSSFAKRARSRDGLQGWCRLCTAETSKSRRERRLEPDDPRHGTTTGYSEYLCRCEPCKAAGMEMRSRRRSTGLPAGDARHGTTNGYSSWGCRCDPCCAAYRAYDRGRRYDLSASQQHDYKSATQCEMCGGGFNEAFYGLKKVVDHCHETGMVRGFIHQGCNLLIALGTQTSDEAIGAFRAANMPHVADYLSSRR